MPNAAFSPLASAAPFDDRARSLLNDADRPNDLNVPNRLETSNQQRSETANQQNAPPRPISPNGPDVASRPPAPKRPNVRNRGINRNSQINRNDQDARNDQDVPNAPNIPNGPNVSADLNAASSRDVKTDAGAADQIDWNAALSDNESWLRSTIATRVGENAAVDEVFQNVALAATRQKAPIRDPRKVGAWLRRLATVYSLLYRRSLGRKKKLLQRYQDRVPVREKTGFDAEPLHWLLVEERRALVREATAQLSDEERRVLTLKYAEERSYKEIAEEIGSTVSAVQSKLHRARARLREKLAELAPNANSPPA